MVEFQSTYRSERLIYVLNYVFKDRLGIDYILTDSIPGPVTIVYQDTPSENGFHIRPHGLLNRTGTDSLDDTHALIFPFVNYNSEEDSNSFPDIFSAIFYHLSRYEEYRTSPDQHGRYHYKNSSLYLNNVLETPQIDVWMIQFKNFLIKKQVVQSSMFKNDTYHTVASIDIDSVFAYKHKNILRQSAAISRDLLKGRWKEVYKRFSTVFLGNKDPNDNFELQRNLLSEHKAFYFIQVGPYGKFDKNVSADVAEFKNIVLKLKLDGNTLGLHPSYGSNGNPANILEEKKILEQMTGSEILDSRQHFLRFELPKTYHALIACGILRDHSMGYSEVPGFRAGTAFPFYWYDLEFERTSQLKVYPFSVMDVTYQHFLTLSVDETIHQSAKIKRICKEMNLPFVFVFHNESLSGHRGWENWDKVFLHWKND